MEFHLYLPQMRMTMPEIVERARGAEQAGFAGIALMDHLAPPMAAQTPMFEAMTAATWVAAKTERLTVGHLVLCDMFRHPVLLAKQAVTLDHASDGRFELGIGWGSVPAELEQYGVGDATPRTRVERLAETLAVLRLLWSGERVSYQGEHVTLREATALPVPTRPIPITIGGTGPRTLALVAEYADWWNIQIGRLDQLDELRAHAGKARVSVQQLVTVIPPDAPPARRDEITALAQRRFGRMGAGGGLVTGTPAELVAYFEGLAARGVDRAYAWFTDFSAPATLAAFAEVIENLR
ncbi:MULTISPECIES: LLM class flavin-dependent oxidoreductase [Pseudofrankia]|uniref:LLM class flavin-dependent oxidoreductase n=1 Tax=Pseudofrankia TaxID=2994363 RepID=UPI000234C02C|nr:MULTISPECIES: LLM class flavin-dependent oxidoreductase [Pseudofrankia]OHV32426.1 NADP oxidoreductase [Pseudofrankia sp. EUN1h]